MATLYHFLHDSSFGFTNNELTMNFLSLPKDKNQLVKHKELSDELFDFYNQIGHHDICSSYKLFEFLPYLEIEKQLFQTNILIARYYEGMGYWCALYYNTQHNYYFFKIMGGSDGHARQENDESLERTSKIDVKYQFHTLVEAFEFIRETTPDYCGEAFFFQHPNVIR